MKNSGRSSPSGKMTPTGANPPHYHANRKGNRPPSPDYATTVANSVLAPAMTPSPTYTNATAPRTGSPNSTPTTSVKVGPVQHSTTSNVPVHVGTTTPTGYYPAHPASDAGYGASGYGGQYAPPMPNGYGGGYGGGYEGYPVEGAVDVHNGSMGGAPPPHAAGGDPFQFIRAPTGGGMGNTSFASNGGSSVTYSPEALSPPTEAATSGGVPPGRGNRGASVGNGSFNGQHPQPEESEETDSLYSGTSSQMSSIRDDLPLCPEDDNCPLINDKNHQRQYSHTCRLFPCYHGNLKYHARLFRHVPGQCPDAPGTPSGSDAQTPNGPNLMENNRTPRQRRRMRKSLKSVNFSFISPNVPNAVTINVCCTKGDGSDVAYEISGDWTQVKVHSLKRYLHQVFSIAPVNQVLLLDYVTAIEDDLASVSECGVVSGSTIQIRDSGDTRASMDDKHIAQSSEMLRSPKNVRSSQRAAAAAANKGGESSDSLPPPSPKNDAKPSRPKISVEDL